MCNIESNPNPAFDILTGPDSEELFLALRLYHEVRKIRFEVKIPFQIDNQVYLCLITSIGVGKSKAADQRTCWQLEGKCKDGAFEALYNTGLRVGAMKFK